MTELALVENIDSTTTAPIAASKSEPGRAVMATMLALIGGVASTFVPVAFSAVRPIDASVVAWTQSFVEHIPNLSAVSSIALASSTSSTTDASSGTQSSGEMVRMAHERSGLTWEQMAKLFSVSRRAVHNWSASGHMNSHNYDQLLRVTDLLKTRVEHTPEENRSWLLTPGPTGLSPFDELRRTMPSRTAHNDVLDLRERLGL